MSGPCLGLPGQPQCDDFALPGKARCATHEAIMRARRNDRHDYQRGPANTRGYDAEWWRNRRTIAKTATNCALCGTRLPRRANGSVSFELDHIVPRADWLRMYGTYAGVNALPNLQALCYDCHSAKTAAENRRRNAA